MNKTAQSLLSKLNFALGRNPIIEKVKNFRDFIPSPYKSVLTITADFELAWAWRYLKGVQNLDKFATEMATQERGNISLILELCNEYNIPVTWGTVGHLFLDSCVKENGKPHPNLGRLSKFENTYWRYEGKDWFEHDPCSDYKKAPEWYCPDLIKKILDAKVNHEIGCHTFSHIDCRDGICPPDLFMSEINECKKTAANFGIKLKTFIYPGHTVGNISLLHELGFTSFRSNYFNTLGYPQKTTQNLWEFKATMDFYYRDYWSVNYHIYRFKKIIERAIRTNTMCNFWFHPSFPKIFLQEILPSIFKFINENQDNIWITTVKDYFDWLNINSQ